MMHGGGRSLEDIRTLSRDDGLKPLLGMKKIPSADAIGNWLRRMGSCNGLDALKVVQNKQLKWALKRESEKGHTLDIIAFNDFKLSFWKATMGLQYPKFNSLITSLTYLQT